MSDAVLRILFILLLSVSSLASATTVLVIHGTNPHMPFQRAIDGGLIRYGRGIDFFVEYLDTQRLPNVSDDVWSTYLSAKYELDQFDVVVGMNNSATEFVLNYRDTLFANAGLAVYSATDSFEIDAHDVMLTPDFQMAVVRNLAFARAHQPNLKKVVVIGEDTAFTNLVKDELEKNLQQSQITFEYWQDYSLANSIDQVANLAADTAIFYTAVFTEPSGRSVIPRHYIEQVAANTVTPIYVFLLKFHWGWSGRR
ncbi:hypothetical protein [Salinibius halmophilus]|uniref:hypothetical protein n=1 Tax=Salinibius halmophilus TaxID=1853216 RepID=UPI0013145978|nr:hypothetical protein [Salinibius halmophilus]